ncbi:putative damage-inducible protein DinB [Silvibacterium bohemicum]|uniref:Putative damage-inducible protein DinB n=1 Tax=Silvibacterium bohemicum TaxID=1577686 RepID=A0A841JU84_9BACT|nr:DinB family protein [Silvibacterium bohemicum]MBB6144027.1 putative damage-inducible protein DinB [Silvibacterium bohemicum]
MTTSVQPPPAVPQPEPWLRGTYTDLPAVLRAVLHAFDLGREDVLHWCAGLSETDLHASPSGLTPIAYHLRHIPRSLDRLLSYAEGNQLSSEQIVELKRESDPGTTREELFTEFQDGLESAAARVRAFSGADLEQPRGVGKKQLPTSVGGLLVHLADHTQRHVGQIVTTAKVLKAGR